MATLPNLSHLRTPTNPHLRLFPSPNPNPNPLFLSLPSSSLAFLPSPPVTRIRCSSIATAGSGGHELERAVHPRPPEIPWSKELANSVRLIGNVGAPVQIKHLSSGKVLAWTRLGVRKSPTETTWINLTFWDELALVAFQHVEKGQQVFVSGRLVSDTVEGEEVDKPRVYYKVVVQELNFIERNMPQVPFYEPETNHGTPGAKLVDYAGNRGGGGSAEELWQAFFANPVDWWDNRMNKRNPKGPDFKHKDTGEALWVEGKYNPPWVKSQLAILDSRMASLPQNVTRSTTSLMYVDDFSSF